MISLPLYVALLIALWPDTPGLALLGTLLVVIGAIGSGLLLVYTVAYTFSAGASALIMAIAAPGGLLMIAWYALAGTRLLHMAADPPRMLGTRYRFVRRPLNG